MGIPSYFSHIAKNHTDIIQKLCKFGKNIDNLYLDSNSIIYDCLRAISTEYEKCANDQEFEQDDLKILASLEQFHVLFRKAEGDSIKQHDAENLEGTQIYAQ